MKECNYENDQQNGYTERRLNTSDHKTEIPHLADVFAVNLRGSDLVIVIAIGVAARNKSGIARRKVIISSTANVETSTFLAIDKSYVCNSGFILPERMT